MKLKELIKNVENVELTPEQEKQIKNYLGIKDFKRWKPNDGERCWTILGDFTADTNYFTPDYNPDKRRYKYGNLFKTKEEAEFALEKIKIYIELKNFADENNGRPIEWQQPNIKNYYIYWSHNRNALYVSDHWTCQDLGQIYFSSEELAKQAIQKVGEDRIKKYLFGVE